MTARPEDAARERLAREVYPLVTGACISNESATRCSERVADFILARQREREGPLVEALDRIRLYRYHHTFIGQVDCGSSDIAASTLARYHALDAPPQRTLAEVAAAIQRVPGVTVTRDGMDCVLVPRSEWDELADALRREKGGK